MPAPYTMPSGSGTFTGLIQWANTTLSGMLGILWLLSIFAVVFLLSIRKMEAGHSFTTAMIFVSLNAILLKGLSIVDGTAVFVCFALTALGFVIISKSRQPY